jgi:hypothetical protein
MPALGPSSAGVPVITYRRHTGATRMFCTRYRLYGASFWRTPTNTGPSTLPRSQTVSVYGCPACSATPIWRNCAAPLITRSSRIRCAIRPERGLSTSREKETSASPHELLSQPNATPRTNRSSMLPLRGAMPGATAARTPAYRTQTPAPTAKSITSSARPRHSRAPRPRGRSGAWLGGVRSRILNTSCVGVRGGRTRSTAPAPARTTIHHVGRSPARGAAVAVG